jgi:AcrR family transcriptional regulator
VRAARLVFGRDGYSRSSIDAIAAEAEVSTRTIYNHFDTKEELFTTVLRESATQVADAFLDTSRRDCGAPDAARLSADLVALGRALAAQRTDFPEHFAMVRQINAEAPHFPREVFEMWRAAGPARVMSEVASRLQAFAEDGLLRLEDPARAAMHFTALTNAEITSRTYGGAFPLAEREIAEIVEAGVAAFLDGYAARRA